jgi:hypothetical protein
MGTRLAEDRETADYSLNDGMARRRDRAVICTRTMTVMIL